MLKESVIEAEKSHLPPSAHIPALPHLCQEKGASAEQIYIEDKNELTYKFVSILIRRTCAKMFSPIKAHVNFYLLLGDLILIALGQEASKYRHAWIRCTPLQQRELMMLPEGSSSSTSKLPTLGVTQVWRDLRRHTYCSLYSQHLAPSLSCNRCPLNK